MCGLYRDHGTGEQFHSELKSDLDIEQLPSGKLCVNRIVLLCGMLAFNLLRALGQEGCNIIQPGQSYLLVQPEEQAVIFGMGVVA